MLDTFSLILRCLPPLLNIPQTFLWFFNAFTTNHLAKHEVCWPLSFFRWLHLAVSGLYKLIRAVIRFDYAAPRRRRRMRNVGTVTVAGLLKPHGCCRHSKHNKTFSTPAAHAPELFTMSSCCVSNSSELFTFLLFGPAKNRRGNDRVHI